MGFEGERAAAIEAVVAACRVCEAVRAGLASSDTQIKSDRSPVTVADFSSQAIIARRLAAAFPDDLLVGEEEAAELVANEALLDRVTAFCSLVEGSVTPATILAAVNRGTHGGGGNGRFWTLDPIDGTKGFLRNDQYAVALALIEDGRVVLGVLGCPNLPLAIDEPGGARGCLFVAVRGVGAFIRSLADAMEHQIRVSEVSNVKLARFCASVETGHSSRGGEEFVAERLGLTLPPLRMDSQCKYGAVARGDAQIYLRLPTSEEYREKIWDHAAGSCILEEAGGLISDVHGQPLDFSAGRTLQRNQGVVAAAAGVHAEVVAAVRAVRASI